MFSRQLLPKAKIIKEKSGRAVCVFGISSNFPSALKRVLIVYAVNKFSFCFINKFERDRFLENLDRKNQKSKLMNIIQYANALKFELEYSYTLRTLFDKIPFVGIIFHSVELWKDLSLLLNLLQNFFNIAANYKKGNVQYIFDGNEWKYKGFCLNGEVLFFYPFHIFVCSLCLFLQPQ